MLCKYGLTSVCITFCCYCLWCVRVCVYMSASVCMKFSNFYSLFFFSAENCVVAVFYHCEKGIKTLSAIGFNVSPLTPQPLAPLLPGTVIRPQLVCMQASPKKYSIAMHTLQGTLNVLGFGCILFGAFVAFVYVKLRNDGCMNVVIHLT